MCQKNNAVLRNNIRFFWGVLSFTKQALTSIRKWPPKFTDKVNLGGLQAVFFTAPKFYWIFLIKLIKSLIILMIIIT